MSEKITLTRDELKGLIDRFELLESKLKKRAGEVILSKRAVGESDKHVRQVWDKIATAAKNGEKSIVLQLTNGSEKAIVIQDLVKERLAAHGAPTRLYFDERKAMHDGAIEADVEARTKLWAFERDLKTDPFLTELRLSPKEEAENQARGQELKRFEVDLTKIAGLLEDYNPPGMSPSSGDFSGGGPSDSGGGAGASGDW